MIALTSYIVERYQKGIPVDLPILEIENGRITLLIYGRGREYLPYFAASLVTIATWLSGTEAPEPSNTLWGCA